MEFSTLLTWSWLNVLTKRRVDLLRETFGDLETCLGLLDADLLRRLGCREDTVLKTLVRLEEFDVSAYARELERRGITPVFLEDERYPERLRTISDPPVFLHVRGDVDALGHPSIALVGTRESSPYGQRVTEAIVPPLVRAGLVTVSGLAQGIDTLVAEATLEARGTTVAVLGHGLGCTMRKASALLADRIVASGGAVVTEYPLDIPPDTHTFPGRNRIISGLALGVVVLEAPSESGALITAEFAVEEGREVFAVPGSVFDGKYAGCNALIATGQAGLVARGEDVLSALGMVAPAPDRPRDVVARDAKEAALLKALSGMPQTVGDLTAKTRLSTPEVNAALTLMELAGSARNMGQGTWVRT